MRKIALIPVDARPVTYDLPKDLAKLAGWQVLLPPKNELGFLKEPADVTKLFSWIDDVLPKVDGFIVSIDMFLYGGLVPSRINKDDIEVLRARLEKLCVIKTQHPALNIMAFSSTMRLSNSYVNQEEKEYWDKNGKEIWAYSFHLHRYKKHGESADYVIVKEMEEKIPTHILADYVATRKKNFAINLSLIDKVEKGLLDLLIFPQDDTSEYGLNIEEQERLIAESSERGLLESIYVYPGADEVASMLTARMIYTLEEDQLPTFYPIYSGMKGALSTAMYEDRALQESVKGQIDAFGSHTVEIPSEADVVLGVNVPGRQQGDMALQLYLDGVNTNDRNIGEWVRKLRYYMDAEKAVAIADVAYANGADTVMVPHLFGRFALSELSGFAAWNTAGNTIGTVISQAALLHLAKKKGLDVEKEKVRQFTIRYLDDFVYQSNVRQIVRQEITNEEDAEALLEKVKDVFLQKAAVAMKERGLVGEIVHVYLPWDRTFEIGVEVEA